MLLGLGNLQGDEPRETFHLTAFVTFPHLLDDPPPGLFDLQFQCLRKPRANVEAAHVSYHEHPPIRVNPAGQ
jgi:hypothetical protein